MMVVPLQQKFFIGGHFISAQRLIPIASFPFLSSLSVELLIFAEPSSAYAANQVLVDIC